MLPSVISTLEYEPVLGNLIVTFKERGFSTTYFGVPIEAYIGLRFASDPDRYFGERIHGHYCFAVH